MTQGRRRPEYALVDVRGESRARFRDGREGGLKIDDMNYKFFLVTIARHIVESFCTGQSSYANSLFLRE